jgi:hypothetical protein
MKMKPGLLALPLALLLWGCASVQENPSPPYPPLAESLHSFLRSPREGCFTLPSVRFELGRYRPYVLMVTNRTVLLQPWPETIDHNWQFHFPPSSYRPMLLTQDEIQKLNACRTRDEVIALLGNPDEEAPDLFPLLPPLGGHLVGVKSRTTQSMHYRWFTVTDGDYVIFTAIQIGLTRTNDIWTVSSFEWNMEGCGAPSQPSEETR